MDKIKIIIVLMMLSACTKEELKLETPKDKDKQALAVSVKTAVEGLGGVSKNIKEEEKEIKSGYKPNMKNIANVVAIDQFRKEKYYQSLCAYVEGFRSTLYKDNIGLAWAFGWNVSLQTTETNKKMISAIGISLEDEEKIIPLSKTSKSTLSQAYIPKVYISPEQGIKAVEMMRTQFEDENGIRSIINKGSPGTYEALSENERAALVYHTYKVGSGGAARYKTMISLIKQYSKSKERELAYKIGAEFKYTYKLNGLTMTDTRSGAFISAMFVDPKAYGALIGVNGAPADLSRILAAAKVTGIDTSKSINEQIEAQDSFGKAKEELLRSGKKFDQTPIEAQEKPFVPSIPLPHGIMG